MPRELIRLVLLVFLIYFLISDILELLSYLPSTSVTFAPLLQRMVTLKLRQSHKLKSTEGNTQREDGGNTDAAILVNKLNLGHGTAVLSSDRHKKTAGSPPGRELTAEETEKILQMRQEWLKAMQEHCLPKLVCELHASLTGQNSLSDAELGILSIIKETSLGTSAEVVSKYHFAAHMGQLLAGVEGNGCHNFYPRCPIAGVRVLEMAKKVRVR